jgi:FkbM family methyltransferase
MIRSKAKFKDQLVDFVVHNPKEDKFVSAAISKRQEWEPELTKIWIDHIQPRDLVIDIGANIGWYSKMALLQGAEVISVEPDPRNFKLLETNCPEAILHNVCLGNEETTLKLNFTNNNFGDTRVSINGTIDVKQITLDSIVKERASEITAIKIDVQGWEPFVVAGGMKTFRNLKSNCLVLLEFCPYMLINNGFDLNCLTEFFSLFKNSYAIPVNTNKQLSLTEMLVWAEEIKDDERLFLDTVNIS